MVSIDNKDYIHVKDLGKIGTSTKAIVNRGFMESPNTIKKVLTQCPHKCKEKCWIVEADVGMLCYLHNVALSYGDIE